MVLVPTAELNHFHQSLPHIQTQLRIALMDAFEIGSGLPYRQRQHNGPSFIEVAV